MTQQTPIPELTTGLVHVVLMEDELVHTQDHPFCDNCMCPCKADEALFAEQVEVPILNGLMTPEEGQRLFWGENL